MKAFTLLSVNLGLSSGLIIALSIFALEITEALIALVIKKRRGRCQ